MKSLFFWEVCGGIPLFPRLHFCGLQKPVILSHQLIEDTEKTPNQAVNPPGAEEASNEPAPTCTCQALPLAAALLLALSPAADSPGVLPLRRSLRLLLPRTVSDTSLVASEKWGRAGRDQRGIHVVGVHESACVSVCTIRLITPSGLRLSLAPRQKRYPFHLICPWGWSEAHPLQTKTNWLVDLQCVV